MGNIGIRRCVIEGQLVDLQAGELSLFLANICLGMTCFNAVYPTV
jgi:hypothetical protein